MCDILREVEHAGHSVQYAGPGSESSPLLDNRTEEVSQKCIRIFWIVCLATLFCFGVSIGCYLIIEEDREYSVSQPLVLINRTGWKANLLTEKFSQYSAPLSHVVITQTSTNNCDNLDNCSKIIRDLQKNYVTARNFTDIGFNFIIAGDGNTYEDRGWKFQPELEGIQENSTLVVALLGNFEYSLPPIKQIEELKVLLKEAVDRGVMNVCYNIILYKEQPKEGGDQLVHFYNKLVMENNHRKAENKCST